eukprot:scaffold1838_cov381-Prasinococcus_capsulatus_cf.AAC.2
MMTRKASNTPYSCSLPCGLAATVAPAACASRRTLAAVDTGKLGVATSFCASSASFTRDSCRSRARSAAFSISGDRLATSLGPPVISSSTEDISAVSEASSACSSFAMCSMVSRSASADIALAWG